MPKKIITDKTIPIALHELDKWSGKLTWELFGDRLAQALGEKRISRHTLLSQPALVEAYNARKDALRDIGALTVNVEADLTIEFAKQQIATLEAKVTRLEKEIELHREQFVRWQHNLYMMPRVDMEKLNATLDKPLPAIKRR